VSFFLELRRRNVFRVGLAYLAGVWLVLQVAALVLSSFDAPGWIMRALVLTLALGFPLALVLAWIYELTPEGIKASEDVEVLKPVGFMGRKLDFAIIGALGLAVAFLVVDNYLLDVPDASIGVADERSIAVLPFVNISADSEYQYFSDGLSEEILNLLARIPGLKVIGRTSSFAFRDRNEDLRAIGEALGVATLLDGSVRMSGDVVRISAQLIDASNGASIWSESYQRTLTDIFSVQDDVAAKILDVLRLLVGKNPTRGRPTESPEAYGLFLRARMSLNDFQLREAEQLVLEAIDLDPEFAEAYELLALVYWTQAGGILEAPEAQAIMGEAASEALSLDPDLVLAQALYAAGNLATYSPLVEIQALERAATLQPDNPWVLSSLIFNLRKAGYQQEALAIARRFAEIDPLSQLAHGRLASTLLAAGRTDEAIASAFDEEEDRVFVAAMNLSIGRDETAVALLADYFEESGLPDTTWVRDLVTAARNSASGQVDLDRRIAETVASLSEERALDMQRRLSVLYLVFGFLDRYYEMILALDLTDSTWTDADDLVDTGLLFRSTGFAADPRFIEVAESLGIVDVWEQRGPPDFCIKVSSDWICEQ
jgi:TolB-like protein